MSGGGGGGQTVVQQPTESAEAKRLYGVQADIAEDTYAWGKEHSLPVIESLISDANAYGTVGRQNQAAGIAQADVGNAFAMQRESNNRDMMRYGVNPASGKFAGMNQQMGIAESLAKAGAATSARRAVDDAAFARKQVASGIASGQSAPALAGISGAAGGLAGIGNASMQAQQQASQFAAQQSAQRSSGMGQLVGTAATLGLGFLMKSSKKLKTDKQPISHKDVLDRVQNLPVEKWKYKGEDADHVGPYAEDFNKSFGLPESPGIQVVDAIGVGLSAIKGLGEKVDRLEKRIGR